MLDSEVQRFMAPKDGSIDELADQVDELRCLFREEYLKNEELYDKRDYDRFMAEHDDWFARRWIIYKRDVQSAFKMVKDTLRWRKEINLNDTTYEDFPREFYIYGCTFEFGFDKMDRRVCYVRVRLYKPVSELKPLFNSFFIFLSDQCDKKVLSKGSTLVFDVSDAGPSNVDVSMLKFMIGLHNRFPLAVREILIVGVPWCLTPVLKSVVLLMPTLPFRIINSDELIDYIDTDQLPSYRGGSSKFKYQVVPIRAKSIHQFEEVNKKIANKLEREVALEADITDCEMVDTIISLR